MALVRTFLQVWCFSNSKYSFDLMAYLVSRKNFQSAKFFLFHSSRTTYDAQKVTLLTSNIERSK